MKRLYASLAVLLMPLVLVSCAQLLGPEPTTPGMMRQAIEHAGDMLVAAFQQGDAAAIAALYTEGARLLPPDSPMIYTRSVIQQFWQGFIATTKWRRLALDIVSVDYDGDLAYEIGAYELQFQPKGEQASRDIGKYVVIWKRQADGSWKIAVDIWNNDSAR